MRLKQKTRIAQGIIAGAMAMCLTVTPALSASVKDVADTDITSAVNTDLLVDNAVSANNIDVMTAKGVVTLKGTVDNILAKERAQALAEATVGVRAIVNRIDVEPAKPRSDKELAQAVKDALLLDPATYSYKINVKADDGVVTLTGTVNSYAKKELSEAVAKDVNNYLVVDYRYYGPYGPGYYGSTYYRGPDYYGPYFEPYQ